MIVCVCNNISEKDLVKNPELIQVVGSKCGVCIRYRESNKSNNQVSLVVNIE